MTNIAFPAILIFLLALFGIIFRYAYRKGDWKIPISSKPLPEEIAYSLLSAMVLHFIWCLIISYCFNSIQIDFEAVFMLVTGFYGHNAKHFEQALYSVSSVPLFIFLYFLTLYLSSWLLGFGTHKFIRSTKLDRRTKLFRYNNDWYYLFKGEIIEFEENKGNFDYSCSDIWGTWLSTIIIQGDEVFLYRGIVEDFYFDKDDNLSHILLSLAMRKKIPYHNLEDYSDNESDNTNDYHDIRGEFFTIQYSQMRTICIEYIIIDTENSEEE